MPKKLIFEEVLKRIKQIHGNNILTDHLQLQDYNNITTKLLWKCGRDKNHPEWQTKTEIILNAQYVG